MGFISFEGTEGETTHENSNGMSGGIIYDLQPNSEKTKICGMILNIGNNLCHFLPSYIIINAIVNYNKAPFEIIDPAEKSIKEPKNEHEKELLKMLYKILSTKQNN